MVVNKKRGNWLLPRNFDVDPLSGMAKWMDRLFYAPFSYVDLFSETLPDVDLVDEGDHFTIKADLPGSKKDDIKLKVNKNSVTIRAETKKEREEKKKNYYYNERASSSYFRNIPLPSEVLPDTAEAKFEDGTLDINVKKAKAEGREVEIK